MVKTFVLIIVVLVCNSCVPFFQRFDDPLTIKKQSYIGSKLKLDGYYYTMYNDKIQNVSFLYRDGVLYNCGGYIENHSKVAEYIEREFLRSNGYKEISAGWGVFQIKEDSIWIESWFDLDGPEKAYMQSGIILNDTTFVITEIYKKKRGKKKGLEDRNKVYHFREFYPKPDSTNSFVKSSRYRR